MTGITYTGVLDVSLATAEALAKLLLEHRERLGTRKGTRTLEPFKQSVLILRWFLDGTRLTQLARDNRISVPTAYRYLHEGLTVLADQAPDLSTALERAAAASFTHLNLDGTIIRTDRVTAPARTRPTCAGRASTSTTAATSRSFPHPTAGRSGSRRSGPAASTTPPAPIPTA
ncbi:MAG: hypothetical protein QOF44_3550 [Streptomyces sp.]|nr:hypothetical protein [Streptomyces sp.]